MPCLLWSCGSHEWKPHWLLNPGDLGTSLLGSSTKTGVQMWVQALLGEMTTWTVYREMVWEVSVDSTALQGELQPATWAILVVLSAL